MGFATWRNTQGFYDLGKQHGFCHLEKHTGGYNYHLGKQHGFCHRGFTVYENNMGFATEVLLFMKTTWVLPQRFYCL